MSLFIWQRNHSKRCKQNFAGSSTSTIIPRRVKFIVGHPGCAFHRVQGPLKNLVWGLCTPKHIILAIDMARGQEVCFVAESNIIKKVRILFDLVLEPPAHHNTFCHVSCCEFMLNLDPVWVQMKILDHDSLHRRA